MVDKKFFYTPTGATMLGLLGPFLWGSTVSLIRTISETVGIAVGQVILYAVAAIFLYFLVGLPNWHKFNGWKAALLLFLASLTSVCLCFAMATSDGGVQTLEVGMFNYLSPCFTILLSMLILGQKARWWVFPGVLTAAFGVFFVVLGDSEFSVASFTNRIMQNPISYFLGLSAGFCWSTYSTLAKKWGNGANPSTVIFFINFLFFSCVLFFTDAEMPNPTWWSWIFVVLGALAMGGAYAAWTHGAIYGSLFALSTASYFTPALSVMFGVLLLDARLSTSFLGGLALIITGSILCATSVMKPKLSKRNAG